MVTVVWTQSNGKPVGFHVQGHANCGEFGSDLVCAAISAIVQTTVLGITEVLKLEAGISVSDGEMTCILSKDTAEAEEEQAGILFATMQKGLESIALGSPGTLKFRYKEV